MTRMLILAPVLALAACTGDAPPPAPCEAPPPRCWAIQLDPHSDQITRVCAEPESDAMPAWWRP